MHLKQNIFCPPPPPTDPTTHPWDYWGGDTKKGEGGLIKMIKHVDFKIYFRDLKHFWIMFFFVLQLRVLAGWVWTLNNKFIFF